MFSDPMVAVMTMLLLFFAGMVLMFVFFTRSLASLREELRESLRKQQMFLTDVEQQFMQISFSLRTLHEGGSAGKTTQASSSSVSSPASLRTPGDIPLLRQEDPLLSMLEATARKNAAAPGFDDQLLPPSPKSKPQMSNQAANARLANDYDPLNDPHLFEDAFLAGPGSRTDRPKRGG